HNAVAQTTGKIGECASFDGSNYLQAASSVVGGLSAMTLGFWMKAGPQPGYLHVLSCTNHSGTSAAVYTYIPGSETLNVGLCTADSGGAQEVNTGLVVADNTWHFVLLRYDGS